MLPISSLLCFSCVSLQVRGTGGFGLSFITIAIMRQFSLAFAALASLLLPLAQAKHVKQTLTITWTPGSPNGATRNIIKTNGQFPAPALTFDENDDVEITVHNNMPFNTTVHWHGLEYVSFPYDQNVSLADSWLQDEWQSLG